MDYITIKGNCKIPSFEMPTFQKAAKTFCSEELDYDTALNNMLNGYYDAWNGKKIAFFPSFEDKDLVYQYGYEAYEILKDHLPNNGETEKKKILVKPVKKKKAK